MNNLELLTLIRTQIREGVDPSTQLAHANDLDAYLERLEQIATTEPASLDQFALERLKHQSATVLAQLEHNRKARLEAYRTTISSGQSALHAAMAINGAAATALLAFVGHLVTSSPGSGVVARVSHPMALFVAGVLAATMAFGSNYVTSWFYGKPKDSLGHLFNGVSVILTAASYVGFGWAAWLLYNLFRTL